MRLEEGMAVEARYRGMDDFYPGVIRRDNRDGTYEIEYDDGRHETRVPAHQTGKHEHEEADAVASRPVLTQCIKAKSHPL